MRIAFIETLMELASKDDRICLLTGDLGFSVLERFASSYPGRFFNTGVAEANMIGLATGLASDGWIPYVYSIATFASMRGYEQIRNGPVLHRLPVRIIGIGGGFAYGHAGPTHHALEDYAIMRTQPGLAVIAPADPAQTRTAILSTHSLEGPVYYRIGKGGDAAVPGLEGRFAVGSVETIGSGRKVLLLCTGGITADVEQLSRELGDATVGVVAAINPAPTQALTALLRQFHYAVSIEEHYSQGGLGSLVSETITSMGLSLSFRAFGVSEIHREGTGSRDYLLKKTGLDRASLAREIRSLLQQQRP